MAKTKNASNTNISAPVNPNNPEIQIPEGYQNQSSDIVGVWESETDPIHFIPLEAKLSDSKIDEKKPSILIFGKLVDECLVTSTAEEAEEDEQIIANPGDLIGVWAKPGMSALKNLAGKEVFMYYCGEKDVGKPNAMKRYAVMAKERGHELPVTDDRRVHSRHVATWLTPGQKRAGNGAPEQMRSTEDIKW